MRSPVAVVVSWLLSALAAFGLRAQSVGVVCAYEANLGVYRYEGRSESVTVEGDYAYIARHQLGLLILDIRDPLNPVQAGAVSLDIGDSFFDIRVEQDIAYVAAGRRGMHIYDVSIPSEPRLLSEYQPVGGGSVRSVEVQDGFAYLACDEQALEIVEVQDPGRPEFVSEFAYRGAVRSLALSGSTLCLCVGELGVELVDVSDPHHPRLLSTDSVGYWGASRAAFSGDVLLIADSHYGMRMLDVSDPLQPALFSMVDPGFVGDVQAVGSRAYVVASDRLVVYDIQNPSEPVEIGVNELHRGVDRVCIRDGLGYLVGGAGDGMRIVNIADLKSSSLISTLGGSGNLWRPSAVVASEGMAFVAWTAGVRVVDVSEPKEPVVISHFRASDTVADSIRDCAVADTLLYLAMSQYGLTIVDVSDPAVPVIMGRCDIGANSYGVEVVGTTAFLCNIDTGLWAIDASNPRNPIVVDRYAENTTIFAASAHGGYLLVPEVDSSTLSILDISQLGNLRRIGEVELPSVAGRAVVHDNYAYMPAGVDQGIHVIDIRDPAHPLFVGTINEGDRVHRLVVRGDRMYAADSYEGLRVFDLADPVRPRQIGVYGRNWSVEYVDLVGEYAVIGDSNFGIDIINISEDCKVHCLPDINSDGSLSPADFSAWVAAFNSGAPACDQNGDGSCTPADFSSWVTNYNAGCD